MSSESALQKQKKESADGLANAPLKKKIGFFSAMMIVVGSCIGAGIFFKAGTVLKDSQNSLILAIFTWIIAAFAVIAMALALIEIASARNDNLSIIGWSQTFNGKIVYKACKNFMVYIYLPLTYFFMPLYVVMSLQDGIGALLPSGQAPLDWWALMLIALAMSVYFIMVCGVSSKVGNIQNWIITVFKFIPLAFAVVMGIVIFASPRVTTLDGVDLGGGQLPSTIAPGFSADTITNPGTDTASIYTFASMTPGFGIFIAIAAIFFAYDGFYVAAGIQSEMKEPKKTPMAILFGLIIVTVIYLLIAIGMSLGTADGTPYGFQAWLESKGDVGRIIYGIFQILIGVGVLGIINGFAMWSTRFMEDLILANEVPFSTKLANKIGKRNIPWVGIVYNLVLSLPIVVIFCIIGGLGYIDAGGYGTSYGYKAAELYSFADLMATWTALLAFSFITFAIAGGIKNRKTNLIKVQKSKSFMPMAICAVIINALAIFFTFFEPIANLFMLFRITGTSLTTDLLVSRIMVVVVLFLFLGLMLLPIFIENMIDKHRYGSLDEAQLEKTKIMAEIKGHDLEEEVILNLSIEKRVVLEPWEKVALKKDVLSPKEIKIIQGDPEDAVEQFADLEKEADKKKREAAKRKRQLALKKKQLI